VGPEPELAKKSAEPAPKPPSRGEERKPVREAPAETPQQAGNQALQTLLRPAADPALDARRMDLDAKLHSDFDRIKDLIEIALAVPRVELDVLDILWRWAREPLRTQPPATPEEALASEYLDQLLSRLRSARTAGNASYYDLMLTRFRSAAEVRRIRDTHSRLYRGEEPAPGPKHPASRREESVAVPSEGIKSGEVADRIAAYFLALIESGESLLHGVALLLAEPMRVLEGAANLARTAKASWTNKDRIWREFVEAPPDQHVRLIARLFGEAEIVIYPGAAKHDKPDGGAITIHLGKLGEAARLSSLMTAHGASIKQPPKPPPPEKPHAEAPEKKTQPLHSARWDSMSWAERKAFVDLWMKDRGITRIVTTHDRHAWPLYLGGPESGPLIAIGEELHRAFHSGLNQVLPGFVGTDRYAGLSLSEKGRALRALLEFTKAFDAFFQTRISPVLARAMEGTAY
jgi:hypothetical protein